MPEFIGTLYTRMIAVGFAIAFYIVFRHVPVDVDGEIVRWRFLIVFLFGVSSFASAIFSFKSAYLKWMVFGEKMQDAVRFVLFTFIYFLVVPFFLIPKMLLLRQKKIEAISTFWQRRHPVKVDIDFLRRMG